MTCLIKLALNHASTLRLGTYPVSHPQIGSSCQPWHAERTFKLHAYLAPAPQQLAIKKEPEIITEGEMVVLSQHATYVCLDAKKMPVDVLSLSSYSLAPGPPASTGSPRHCIRFCWFARQASKQSLPGFLPEIPQVLDPFLCERGMH